MSCAATSPTGRLTRNEAEGTFEYLTAGGWTVRILDGWIGMSLVHGNGLFKYELWGSSGSNDPSIVWTHENLGGKHIKDRFDDRRTHLLPGGTVITVTSGGNPAAGTVSIYDDDQTHRIDVPTRSVTRSCAIGMFEEEDEPDGETSRFVDTETGLLFEHVYDQAASSTGAPLPKIEDIYLLGELFSDDLNQVNDFFDDPRLGHT